MKTVGAQITTRLDVDVLTHRFQMTAQKLHGFKAKLGSAGRSMAQSAPDDGGFHYFAPNTSGSAGFAGVMPTASLGASIPKFAGTGGGATVVHMYIWDRGSTRQVEVLVPHTIGSGSSAKKALHRMVAAIQDADPSCTVRL